MDCTAISLRPETFRTALNAKRLASAARPSELWHVPNDPDTRSTRQLVDLIYQQAGQPRTKLRAMPPLMLRALGLFNPAVRELTEMQYLFEEPFIVGSSKIANKLGVRATSIDQALDSTLATYRG